MENYKKGWTERLITLGLVVYFVFGYLPIADWNAARGIYHVVGVPWEERIPFLAPFILGYSLVYGSVFLIYWIIPSRDVFKKMAWGFFWVTTVHYVLFVLFPVKMIWRPEIIEANNFFDWLARFIFSLDNTYNCFPSLHVAYPTLAAVLAWRFVPKHRWLFISLTLLTAVSVVLVKQHYIADAMAGAVVSILIGVLSHRNQAAK
ncbi:MAG: phosphatase PAP2 family protein [Deltaproteobacteria bacterium]|nr:phosphatase PAP2 family protein [Deltaproteobacteria bacterium]MBI4223549.1 phosphatase PAP2 family protein [Deltaproteobacteria bacterium]